jgi:hypothetical protein
MSLSVIEQQPVLIQRLIAPEGKTLSGSYSIPPIAGALGYDAADPENLYVGDGAAWNPLVGGPQDITMANFGSVPNANGAVISAGPNQTLTLEPASVIFPGGVSTVAQTFQGVKTFNSGVKIENLDAAIAVGYNTPTFFEQDNSFGGTLPILSLTAGGAAATEDWSIQKVGKTVMININAAVAVTIAVNGNLIVSTAGILPSKYRPLADKIAQCVVQSNSTVATGYVKISTAGTLTFYTDYGVTGFSNAGVSGPMMGTFIYSI